MTRDNDLILVMESGHKRALLEIDPTARGKVYRICEYSQLDVEDPYRLQRAVFESCLVKIEQATSYWAAILKAQKNRV